MEYLRRTLDGSVKKIYLYLWVGLTVVVWLAVLFAPLWAKTPAIASADLTLPFLAWIILTVYYSVRWFVRRAGSHKSNNGKSVKR